MTTKVIIGCNEIRDYSFYAPLTGLVWKHVIGMEPIFFITGDWQAKRRNQLARQALADNDFLVISLNPSERFSTATVAQNVRQHAAMMPFLEDDLWLMPSDVDLWPIRKSFYHQHEAGDDKAVCYYANGDHYQTIPMCHPVMRAKTWREVYNLPVNGVLLEKQIDKTISDWLPGRKQWLKDENFAIWMADQGILTDKLRAMPWFAEKTRMIERRGHPPVDRLDRGGWPHGDYRLEDYVDSHLLRPGDQPQYWPRTLQLFKMLLPQYSEWAEKYREAYIAGY